MKNYYLTCGLPRVRLAPARAVQVSASRFKSVKGLGAAVGTLQRIQLLTVLIILCCSQQLKAAVVPAASVGYDDVNFAISQAVEGDTVRIPAGSAIWGQQIKIDKGITITGAGTNAADASQLTVIGNVQAFTDPEQPLFLINPLRNGAGCAGPPTGIVGWWPGEGNGNDIARNTYAQLVNGVCYNLGEVGKAFSFDGTSGYISVPASASLDVGTQPGFTIECWIKPTDLSVRHPIVEWNNGSTIGVHFYVSHGWYDERPGDLMANIEDTSGGWHPILTPAGLLTTHTFQHVALTYDKTSGWGYLYLNGTVVASANLGSFTPQTSFPLYMGRRPSDSSVALYGGLLDEVTIYSRALSQAEIQGIHAAGTIGKCNATSAVTIKNIWFEQVSPGENSAINSWANDTAVATQLRITRCIFEGFHSALRISATFGVVDQCDFLNNRVVSRNAGLEAVDVAQIPVPSPSLPWDWDSANTWCYEDCHMRVDPVTDHYFDKYFGDTDFPAAYTVRNCVFDINRGFYPDNNAGSYDGWDMHGNAGDSTKVNTLGIQIYSNTFNYYAPYGSSFRLADIRGGYGSLVYSNIVNNLNYLNYNLSVYSTVRNEDNGPCVNTSAENTYLWKNYANAGSSQSLIPVYDDCDPNNCNPHPACPDRDYFLHEPSGFKQLAYPHPLRATCPSDDCESLANIVAWWPAEGTGHDVIGNHDGQLDTGVSYGSGVIGQAFSFNVTSGGSISVPASPSLDVGIGNGFTIDCWIKPSDLSVRHPIVEWNNGSTIGVHFYVSHGWYDERPGDLMANIEDTGGGWHPLVSDAGLLTTSAYQHVALTYDKTSGTGTLYLNGVVVASANLGIFTPQTSFPLYMGKRPSDSSVALYSGLMDELTIHNRALSQTEIITLYLSGKCQPPFSFCPGSSPPIPIDWSSEGSSHPASIGTGAQDPAHRTIWCYCFAAGVWGARIISTSANSLVQLPGGWVDWSSAGGDGDLHYAPNLNNLNQSKMLYLAQACCSFPNATLWYFDSQTGTGNHLTLPIGTRTVNSVGFSAAANTAYIPGWDSVSSASAVTSVNCGLQADPPVQVTGIQHFTDVPYQGFGSCVFADNANKLIIANWTPDNSFPFWYFDPANPTLPLRKSTSVSGQASSTGSPETFYVDELGVVIMQINKTSGGTSVFVIDPNSDQPLKEIPVSNTYLIKGVCYNSCSRLLYIAGSDGINKFDPWNNYNPAGTITLSPSYNVGHLYYDPISNLVYAQELASSKVHMY